MTKRFGFTLAEVLITLGIIGVVAAMSIPTLIANTNSAKFRSQFKKTVATLNQAALMSQAQYDFDYSGVTEATTFTNEGLDPRNNTTVGAMLAGTLSGVTVTQTSPYEDEPDGITDAPGNKGYAKLADGSIFVFNTAAVADGCSVEAGTPPTTYVGELVGAGCVGWIDVNGATKPNAESLCTEDGVTGRYTDEASTCTVKADAAHTRDIYPVVYHDGILEPSTYAGRAILSTTK